MKIAPWTLVASLATATMCGSSSTTAELTNNTNTSAARCTTAQAATFAWWVGTWDYAIPGFDPGVTTVTASNAGCSLQEEFVDIHNMKAHTTISFDSTTQKWKRTVADPFRTYNSTGTFATDGSIAFFETTTDRESYRPTDKTHIHFTGESSSDGGKTWKLLFDATYTKRP
ncbi:MAG: hypothetical protein ABJF01_16405 [bacterium]